MRVLLYAPVDLNLIDGSAIWCLSVAQTLCHDPRVQVDLLLNTGLKRTVNTQALNDQPRVRLLDAWNPGDCAALRAVGGKLGPRFKPEQAFERIERLDADEPYDLFIVRGGAIGQMVAVEPRLASRAWVYLTQAGADLETCRVLAHSNARIACQTPLLQAYLEGLLGTSPGRYVPLPPMAPKMLCERPRVGRQARRVCYVGKFDADYMIEESLAGFANVQRRLTDAEFLVAGDKFHDPDGDGAFRQRVTTALQNTPGVSWRGDLPREAVGRLLFECDLGSCWRSAKYDDSLELSTKVLEYGAAGLPVLLNPSQINRLTFGDDYPLYVDSPESFEATMARALEDDDVCRQAAEMMFDVSRRFTFAAVSERLRPFLDAEHASRTTAIPAEAKRAQPTRIVFAGHDLKFCREIIEHFQQRPDCIVRVDEWMNHTRHNEVRSEELLRWANVVYCEWCLGNAVWYSARVRPAQRLVIRLHLQERTTGHPDQVNWDSVDHLVFIAQHVHDEVLGKLGDAFTSNAHLIYNTFDAAKFDQPKREGAEFRLGLLGYCPMRKNPQLALEILAGLHAQDERWRLALTGRPPQGYSWLWARPEEREFYERFEAYIVEHGLESALIRQDWTDDPAAWYASIDFILSCSDFEGSHQAVAEGMAAGCIPVVHQWEGAAEMYPNSLLIRSADEAVERIRECAASARRVELQTAAKQEALRRFDTRVILPQLEPLLLGGAIMPVHPPLAMRGPAASPR